MAPQHLIRNESEAVVYSNIRSLRDQSQFLDVSLVCEDGARLAAHKIILAAHSDKFRRILGQMTSELLTPVTHSIFLTGVNKEELSFILDFIYEGEVSVSQAGLSKFLNVAEKLHINSLVNGDKSPPSTAMSQEPTTVAENSEQEKNRYEEVIEEEVYLASKNETAIVEDILVNKPEDEREVYMTSVTGERLKRSNHEQTVDNCSFEEYQFPDPSSLIKQQKDTKMNESKIDANKVLIENLKVLGMSKLRRDILTNPTSRKFFKKIMSKPTMKLPCPVQLMNSPQLCEWLIPEVRKDYIEQGLAPKVKVPWGDPEFHPTCWPEKLWPWHLVSNPQGTQKHSKPNNVSLVDTLKAAVSNRLRHLNINPETYVSEEYTEEEDIKKRRARGFKVVNKL